MWRTRDRSERSTVAGEPQTGPEDGGSQRNRARPDVEVEDVTDANGRHVEVEARASVGGALAEGPKIPPRHEGIAQKFREPVHVPQGREGAGTSEQEQPHAPAARPRREKTPAGRRAR